MNYKIGYLPETSREISLGKAAEVIGVNIDEAINQLAPFVEYMDETHIRLKKLQAIDWTEKYVNIIHFEAVYTEQERRNLLYLMIYSNTIPISVFHF